MQPFELQSFELFRIAGVPREPGVYIIYIDGKPFYVGRSRVDIRERLLRHANKTGSQKIREALDRGLQLEFTYYEMMSCEQAEAQLIAALGTIHLGNLRRESDPADWE